MDKIIFEDLPSKNTPLSAENLNKLQNNIEEAIEKVIIELFGTSEKPINANEIIDIGIYKISGVIENFHNNIVYNQFIMYVNWDEYKLVQTIIGEGCIYYRSAEEFRGSFNWSDWQLQSSGGITGGDTLPIGTILPFGSDTVPENYLLCKGQELPRAEFRELFNVIGTTYGEGDGSTTFALPNLCGRVPIGKDSDDTDFDTLGKTGGEKTHTLTVNEMPSHKHNDGVLPNEYFGEASGSNSCVVKADKSVGTTSATGGGQPHNNLQPYIVTNYIIKAKNTAIIKGEVIQETGTASETNVYSSVAVDNKIQALKRVTLYENASGTNANLTLNDSVANYEDIEIFYKSNDNAYSSVKVNNANNKNIVLINMTPNTTNNVLYVKSTVVKAQNNSITVVDGLEGYGSGGITTGNKNYIVKVVGYKEV